MRDLSLLEDVAYNFYGVSVSIKSNSEQVLSRFARLYEFFGQAGARTPSDLEMTILVKDEQSPPSENSVISARTIPTFDGWKHSIRGEAPSPYVSRTFEQTIREVDGPSRGNHRFYHIHNPEALCGEWYAGLETLIFSFVMHNLPHLVVVHSGAVSSNGNGILFCGSADSGKSVLSYAFARRGFRYLSDEYGLFAPDTLQVFPFPRGISFKPEAAQLFPELKPLLDGAEVLWRNKKRHMLSFRSLSIEVATTPAKASFLFFVKYDRSDYPQVAAISARDAVEKLRGSWNLYVLSPRESRSFSRTDALVALCNNARCYELVSGDLDKTFDLVNSVVR